jgi:hypothetical protein
MMIRAFGLPHWGTIKVLCTLAALLPAKLNASSKDEKTLAGNVLTAEKIRLILHLEQPKKASRLFPRPIDPASVQQKLRQRLKAIDPHAVVSEMHRMGNLSFRVS